MDEQNMKSSVIEDLKRCTTAEQWNAVCDRVKNDVRKGLYSNPSGDYPSWWYMDVICAGLHLTHNAAQPQDQPGHGA